MLLPVSEIYEDFLESVESETIALKRNFLVRKSLNKYLKNSITRFSTCRKRISIIGTVLGDGEIDVGNDTFIIKNCPKKPNIEIYYELEDKGIIELCNIKDYDIIDLKDGNFEVRLKQASKEKLYVDYFLDGSLDVDSEEGLTELERRIIVEGMVIEWLLPQINREDNLKQRVANKEFKKLSNATMLNSLVKIDAHRRNDYKNLVNEYSYRNFKGFD